MSGISASPLLLAEAILSNVGGVATLIGGPPNILIASDSDLSFNDFLSHALPVALLIIPLVIGLVLLVFRRMLVKTKDTTQALPGMRLEEAWNDRTTAGRVVMVLAATLVLFLLQDVLRLTPTFIALSRAAVAWVWTQPPVDEFLKRIDWQVLSFFASLFVIVGGLEASGALEILAAGRADRLGGGGPAAAVAILWGTAVAAALVDNVPITAAMIPITLGLGGAGDRHGSAVVGPGVRCGSWRERHDHRLNGGHHRRRDLCQDPRSDHLAHLDASRPTRLDPGVPGRYSGAGVRLPVPCPLTAQRGSNVWPSSARPCSFDLRAARCSCEDHPLDRRMPLDLSGEVGQWERTQCAISMTCGTLGGRPASEAMAVR